MATQWKNAGMGGLRTGLDYTALEPAALSLGLPWPISPAVFSDLRYMEAEALNQWSKHRG
jgi:hypothetical protein